MVRPNNLTGHRKSVINEAAQVKDNWTMILLKYIPLKMAIILFPDNTNYKIVEHKKSPMKNLQLQEQNSNI